MAITYTNHLGENISEAQISGLTEFFKVKTLNGQLKTKEYFLDGQFLGLYYYRDNNETIQDISIIESLPVERIVIVDKVVYNGGYTLEKHTSFNNQGIENYISNRLHDSNGNRIGYEVIDDLTTNIPDYNQTKKFFFDKSVNPDDYLFECTFNEDGSLMELYYNSYHTEPTGQDSEVYLNTPEDINTLRKLTGISQQLVEYYMVANVIPNF